MKGVASRPGVPLLLNEILPTMAHAVAEQGAGNVQQ
jgi:hypothetical protein